MAKKYGSAALQKAKDAAKRARAKAKNENSALIRKGAMFGSGYAAGRKEDYLERASVGPLSGEVVIGGIAMLMATRMGGIAGSAIEGVGDSMLTIASFKAGQRAAGGASAGAAGEDELPALEAQLRALESETAGESADDLHAWADAAEAAGWAPSEEPVDADYEDVLT